MRGFQAIAERALAVINSKRMTRRGLLAIGAAGAGSLLLAGCGTVAAPQPAAEQMEEKAEPAQEAAPGYTPVTIDNCGFTITYDQPPQRAITLSQEATELMLALGLQDSMVGTSYLRDWVHPDFQAAYDKIPVLAEKYPSHEVILGTETDFVYAAFVSAWEREDVAGPRDALLKLGIGSYQSAANCKDGKVTVEDVFEDFLKIGQIFGVTERAEAYVEEQRARLAEIRAKVGQRDPKVTVFIYDGGTDSPYAAVGTGMGNALVEEAGGINIFADVEGLYATVNWETVVERDPDVIVLFDMPGWSTAAEKIEYLEGNEALHSIKAVQNKRYVEVRFTVANPGIYTIDTIELLVNAFYPE